MIQGTAPTPERVRARWRTPTRRVGWVLGVGLALLAPMCGRVAWEGRAELSRAEAARELEDLELEIEHLGRAARWRAPVLGHDEQAIARLVEIGEEREATGEDGTSDALVAYREARGSLLATRSWGVPQPELFDDLNHRIARLMAEQERRFGTDVGGEGDPEAYHYGLLGEVPGGDPIRGNLAALAFVAWIGAAVGFVLRGIDEDGKLRAKAAVRWGSAFVVLLGAWALLLRMA
jgi:hypothetical protein